MIMLASLFGRYGSNDSRGNNADKFSSQPLYLFLMRYLVSIDQDLVDIFLLKSP